MNAYEKTQEVRHRIERVTGIEISQDDAHTLRRAERTLHRWSEDECGVSNHRCSWAIVRDEETGKPYREIHPHRGESRREPIPDRERGALKRVREVCERNGLHFHYQGDPRGCALYVHSEPIDDRTYTRGAHCSAST